MTRAGDGGRSGGTPRAPHLVCGVEDGWRGVREFSLAAAREGLGVVVLIRDRLEPEVLALITTPPQMRVSAVSRTWFRVRLVWEVLRAAVGGRLRWVIVTRARTRRWLTPVAARCRAEVWQLIEDVDGYRFEGAGCASPLSLITPGLTPAASIS